MYKTCRERDGRVNFGIFSGGQALDIVDREIFHNSILMTEISSFVIGNGCCFFVFIHTDLQISIDMDLDLIGIAAERSSKEYTKIWIDDLDIGITQIMCITV